jgi:uncharacterized membrane protein (DUF4010 family)
VTGCSRARRSGLILAALLLLVAPLVPNEALWQGLLNPHVVMRLLLVLLVIQSLAHVGRRLLQARQAMALSALASGFVSSTATIASLGMEAREGVAVRAQAGAAVLSCVATMAQIVVVAAAVQPAWLVRLWAPALAGAGGRGLGLVGVRGATGGLEDGTTRPQLPARHGHVQAARRGAHRRLADGRASGRAAAHALAGRRRMLAGALLAALADVHAATAALLVQGGPASPMALTVAQALMAALLVHAGSKSAVALASGGWRYALAVAPGIVAQLAFVGVMALWG